MNIYFAPLQGYTEDTYRRIHHELVGGVETYYSPFLRIEHGGIRSKDARDLRPDFNEGTPFVPQIIAKNLDEFTTLVDYVAQLGYREIDLNMGCPFPLQTRHGRGAGLLQNPENVAEIFNAISQHNNIAFSVKMRLGQESPEEGFKLLPLINDTPLRHVTLHPRLGIQQYKGDVHTDLFEQFANELKHPIIYNGDVRTLDDILQIEKRLPQLKGIMIGRGLLARPSLAQEYADGACWDRHRCIRLIRNMHEHYHAALANIIPGEAQLLRKLQTFWDYADEDLLNKKTLKKVRKAGSLRNYLAAISEIV